jgi:two-component system chemotaxis response regulator CheY
MATVLVVDDEPDVRFLLRLEFEVAGHQVSEAADGAAALKLIETFRPDLIVTDLMMPVMDGRELIARLRADAKTAGIPILQLSSNPDLAAGADACLNKLRLTTDAVAISERLIERSG